nr:MAG TPA: hypothetical protein [Caudoviricetes sp.]
MTNFTRRYIIKKAELICIENIKGVENEQQDNYKHKEV